MTSQHAEAVTVDRVTITLTDEVRYLVTVNRSRRRPPHGASLMFHLSPVELAYLEQAAGQILRPAQVNNPDEMRWRPTPENRAW